MSFVIRLPNGNYADKKGSIARYQRGTPDLQKAVTYKRRCDAANASVGGEITEVKLVVVRSPADRDPGPFP